MKSYVGRLLLPLFVIALALTISNALVFFFSLHNLINDERLVGRSHEVAAAVEAVSSAVRNAESMVRGYIISGNEDFLRSYPPIKERIPSYIQQLKNLTDDNRIQQKNITHLTQSTKERILQLDTIIIQRREQGFDAAQSLVSSGDGTTRMHEISVSVVSIEKEEARLLKIRAQESTTSIESMYTTITVSLILNLLLVVIAFFFIRRELHQRSLVEERKNDFISIASHELKTPITSMSVFTDLLKRRVTAMKDKQANHYLKKIQEQIQKQTLLINDLLDISKMQAGKIELQKEAFDLNKLIHDSIEIMETTNATHKFIIKGKIQNKVFGDRQRIGQVLINFLSNAVKYSPKADKVIITLFEEGQYAKIGIQDFGIGIAKRHQRKIFNRFYRALEDKNIPGLGIGLYITFEIIRRHDGKVWVESQEGKGSIFTFTVPVARYI